MEQLLHWDTELLLAINSHHTPFWDQIMWYSSQSWLWIPLYLLLIYTIFKLTKTLQLQEKNSPPISGPLNSFPKVGGEEATRFVASSSSTAGAGSARTQNQPESRKSLSHLHIYHAHAKRSSKGKKRSSEGKKFTNLQTLLLVLAGVASIAIAAGLSDFITSGLLKKTICRPRPTHSEIADLLHIVRGYTGGHYGFPSSHAANTCAVATSFLMIMSYLKRLPHRFIVPDTKNMAAILILDVLLKILVILYVVLNCYSRMYLGVHYPLDILCGALIGTLLGYILGYLFARLFSKLLP